VYPGEKPGVEEKEYSGDFLMKVGLNTGLSRQRTSVVVTLKAKK